MTDVCLVGPEANFAAEAQNVDWIFESTESFYLGTSGSLLACKVLPSRLLILKGNGLKDVDYLTTGRKGAGVCPVRSLGWFRISASVLVKELLPGESRSSAPIVLYSSVLVQDDSLKCLPFLRSHLCRSLSFYCNSHQDKRLCFCQTSVGQSCSLASFNPSPFGPGMRGQGWMLSRESSLIIILITRTPF